MVRSIMMGLLTFGIILSFLSAEVIGDNNWLISVLNTSNGSEVPSLILPVKGSVVGGSSVTLVWTPIEKPGIAGYVLVYRMGGATNPGNPSTWIKGSYLEIIIPGQATISYSIALQENTSDKPFYWWSIATINSSGQKGSFPSPLNFSVDNTAPNISLVELMQPIDSTLSIRIPTFTWRIPLANYQDVASWTLEYASDIQLQQNRKTITGLINLPCIISNNYASISYTLPSAQALSNGTWYWHISAKDAAGNESAFTMVKSFVINVGVVLSEKVSLVSPPNGFADTPAQPTFSWLPAQGASSYWLQIDNDNGFSSPKIDRDGIVTTSFMAPSEFEPGDYYWRVTSNASNSEWSDVWLFTIPGGSSPPAVVTSPLTHTSNQVTLVAPYENAEGLSPTPLFQWEFLEGATTYTLEVSTDDLFTDLVVEKISLTSTHWGTIFEWISNNPSELNEGIYYWRVSSDQPDSTSSVWKFSVRKPEVEKPSLFVTVSDIYDNPIDEATVTLTGDESTITRYTDALGNAVFTDLKKDTYILEVRANAFSTYQEQLNISGPTSRTIKLHRGAVIYGFLYYDSIENPAENMRVIAYESKSENEAGSDITDNEGRFIIDNLSHLETYYIVVEGYENQKIKDVDPEGSPRTSTALRIVLISKKEIIGVVQDKGGTFVPNIEVTLRGDQGQFIDSTCTNNTGSFTFRAVPGKYYIEILLFGCKDYVSEVFVVEYNERKIIRPVTLESMIGVLNIYLRDMNGTSLEGSVTILDTEGNQDDFIVDKFKSINLCPGRYTMAVYARGFLSRAISLTIQSGENIQAIELMVEPERCAVVVKDMEGNPIPEAQVFIDDSEIGETDSTGSIFISSIIPGTHYFSAEKLGYISSKLTKEIVKGEEIKIEILLKPGPFYMRFLGFAVQYKWYIGTLGYIFNLAEDIYGYIIKKKGENYPLWKKILIIIGLFPFFVDIVSSRI
jgi:hypothetical protein